MKRILLTLSVMLLCMSQGLYAQTQPTWEGEGTKDNPFIVTSAEQMQELALLTNSGNSFRDKYFKLQTNLDFAGKEFIPIGKSMNHFRGHFDGDYHFIYDINIYDEKSDYQGVFGIIYGNAEVKNLTVERCLIGGRSCVGGIVGYNIGATVSNCHSIDDVIISGVGYGYGDIGGIVGRNTGVIENCTSKATLTNDGNGKIGFGGIAGRNLDGTLRNNLAISANVPPSEVPAFQWSGAITGSNTGTLVKNHYVSCMVNGNSTNVGTDIGDVAENEGAMPAFYISSIARATLSKPSKSFYNTDYYAAGSEVTLRAADGYIITEIGATTYGNNTPITLSQSKGAYTFTMPYDNVRVKGSAIEGVTLVDDDDNSDRIVDGKQTNVQLNGRTLYRDGLWNTLCLPFDISNLDGTPLEGALVMTLGNSSGCDTGYDESTGSLSLDFIESYSIEAGHAYLVKWETKGEPIVNPVFENVTLSTEDPTDQKVVSQDGYIQFIGTYNPVDIFTVKKTNLYLGSDNNLYYPWGEGMTEFKVNAFRAYFQLNGLACGEPSGDGQPINNFELNFGGESNGIKAITGLQPSSSNVSTSWYTLDGRRLNGMPTTKGIYINNNKKVVIK